MRDLGGRHSERARSHPRHARVGGVRRRPVPPGPARTVRTRAWCVHHLQRRSAGLFGVAVLILFARPFAGLATLFTVVEYFWLLRAGARLRGRRVARLGAQRRVRAAARAAVVDRRPEPGAHRSALYIRPAGTVPGHQLHPCARWTVRPLRGAAQRADAGRTHVHSLQALDSAARHVDQRRSARSSVIGGLRQSVNAVFGGALELLWRRPRRSLQASAIGTLIGILPGAGADIAAWVSYGMSKRTSSTPEEYGRGSLEGVADAGAANNSALAGAWVPALTLGIPGDSITAIVLGIMMMKNLQPGPEIFDQQAVLVYSLYLVFVLANLALLPAGFLAVRASGTLIRVPRHTLLPVIVLFCVLGSYAIAGSYFDVGVMLAMGVLGFVLERRDVPVAPIVLGIILGGPLEERFIQAMTASQGSLDRVLRAPAGRLPGGRRDCCLAAAGHRRVAQAAPVRVCLPASRSAQPERSEGLRFMKRRPPGRPPGVKPLVGVHAGDSKETNP